VERSPVPRVLTHTLKPCTSVRGPDEIGHTQQLVNEVIEADSDESEGQFTTYSYPNPGKMDDKLFRPR
jgi:hypothetical protein